MRETEDIGPAIPRVEPAVEDIARPLWSVMIPNYNSGEYLRKTLQSVLAQDRGTEEMQIEVVDHCSTEGDPEALVGTVGGGRVSFYRRPKNEGAVANFNACIQRSRGRLIHILHSDDYLLPGFYEEIERMAGLHANTALLATRCFYVDESDVITSVTPRILELESAGRSVESLYYDTPIQFPGVVIRREFYEAHGGYLTELVHVADREMWARAVCLGGGVLSSGVLACYRMTGSNDTSTVLRSGENVRDLLRVAEVFRKRYPGFSMNHARRVASYVALKQARRFSALNDFNSARVNWRLWTENSSWLDRIKETVLPPMRRVLGRDRRFNN
ncbi:MAG TPA: glycosyltransferase [Candidatus Sulfopaludibacter sp.]|nr:glycosyltransferase [Candidatus Sulfopaludibacter sp.]